jgi:hypothetical protein
MDINKNNKIVIILMLPWIIIAPMLIYFEFNKLYLSETINLNLIEKQNYYLKRAMPGLEDDYFKLINSADKYMNKKRYKYKIYVNESLSVFVKSMVRNYIIFALSPARQTIDKSKMDFELYYRVKPNQYKGEILEVISGFGVDNSYIVRCSK